MQSQDVEKQVAMQLSLSEWQVKNVLSLTDSENTVHFIARYRKEKTGNLDEIAIRDIIEIRERILSLNKAKESALKNITEQGKLTDSLKQQIGSSKTLAELEDIYAPYKRKKKTKADIALEKGFGPVALQIRRQEALRIAEGLLKNFSREEIIVGAQDIISQEIADDARLKDYVRKYYTDDGFISSKLVDIEKLDEKQKADLHKFQLYDSFYLSIKRLKSYQVLALNRGENLKILSVKLDKSVEFFERFKGKIISKKDNSDLLAVSVKQGYNRIFDSIEGEIRNLLTREASKDAIVVFQDNLKKLLMLRPHYNETVLAIDPGFRTGCKICLLDKNANPVIFSKIFLEEKEKAVAAVKKILSGNGVDVIVLGNGTASVETYELLKGLDKKIVVVNESGASVYSASVAGSEEFPNLDSTDRGTVSIGRRYIDCMSELVKVPVISIGIGMYQHDMDQKELEKKLSEVTEDAVNLVGINVNVASVYLLSYVSGLSSRTAKKLFENRPYKTRMDLKKVLTPKAFEQSIGFLRIPNSPEMLDNTAVHPQQYELARFVISHNCEKDLFQRFQKELDLIYPGVTQEVVLDVIKNYQEAGKELRTVEGNLAVSSLRFEDLKIGDVVKGIVRNVMPFGAFVDIGVKNNGLIHISQIADRFVKDPKEIVSIGEELRVKIIGIDKETQKIQLSLKDI
jgi:uncharacterized protein